MHFLCGGGNVFFGHKSGHGNYRLLFGAGRSNADIDICLRGGKSRRAQKPRYQGW